MEPDIQKKELMSQWFFACDENALEEGGGIAVFVEGHPMALFKVEGRVYVLDNFCPHQGAPLHKGFIAGHTVVCPRHGWEFNIQTGCGLTLPDSDVTSYPVKIEEGKVLVDVEKLLARPKN